MPCGHLNAMRFAQKPLAQPGYSFVHVPKASGDLRYSSIQLVQQRDQFQTCMAEMLLLGKEAVRRRRYLSNQVVKTDSGAKPLSLEYLADRLDIDDPCFGFLVRTLEKPVDTTTSDGSSTTTTNWQAGMLQGFITVTTFTNWQATFQWDSLHPEAYRYDPPLLQKQRKAGIRKWDSTGELSRELQATVHCGDMWNEGIVWPRIAEISLLGGLGCGRTLVQMVIEHLENLKATAEHNYDYVVLQATDNSIPFYESLGFVRVGGIMQDKKVGEDNEEEDEQEQQDVKSKIISSPMTQYVTQKRGETPQEIAKKLRVNVWDILFLNKGLFVDAMTPNSKLLLGTTLQVPVSPPPVQKKKTPQPPTRVLPSRRAHATAAPSPIKAPSASTSEDTSNDDNTAEDNKPTPTFYTAKENDTPRSISKTYKVNCQDLIQANIRRLPGLLAKSRLKAGTRVQVSHFDIQETCMTAYAHWSFPDDQVEDGEPSYMMVYKLQRDYLQHRPIEQALKATVQDYTPTPLLWPPTPEKVKKINSSNTSDDGGVDQDDQERMEAATSSTTTTPAPSSRAKRAAMIVSSLEKLKKATSTSEPSPVLVAKDVRRDTDIVVKVSCGGKPFLPPPSLKTTAANEEEELKPPKRAMGPFLLFCVDERKRIPHLLSGKKIGEISKILTDRWLTAQRKVKQKYEALGEETKREYFEQKALYEKRLAERNIQQQQQQQQDDDDDDDEPLVSRQSPMSQTDQKKKEHEKLYNKIVKIKPEALTVTSNVLPKDLDPEEEAKYEDDPTRSAALQPDHYEYWFVLTYIPDLKWCHLVPLVRVGEFTEADKKVRLVGRPKWKLVDERLGQEIDISSRYVVPVKSRETKRCADADKEEWDIVDQDKEDDASSVDGSSAGDSASRKRGRKRKSVDNTKARAVKKRVFESPFHPTSKPPKNNWGLPPSTNTTATEGSVPNTKAILPLMNMPSSSASGRPPALDITTNTTAGSSSSSVVIPPSAKVPPTFEHRKVSVDMSSSVNGEPPTLDNTEASSMSDHSGSPPSPTIAPQCLCDSGHHCPVHPSYYHHGYHHPPPPPNGGHYGPPPPYHHHHHPYGPPPPRGYYSHMHPRFHRPPPPPGWPSNAPYPPPAPYSENDGPHYYPPAPHGHGYPPDGGYYRSGLPPLPLTPPGRESLDPRLEMSVERETAV